MFDLDNDGLLSTVEIVNVNSINVSNMNISDLTGVGVFTFLESLYCSDNNLQSLDLEGLDNLTSLYCDHNQLTGILNLEDNYDLESVFVSNNSLSGIAFDMYGYNTSLETLYCSNNKIESLDVSEFHELTDLSCGNNQLKTLNVANNTKLEELYCEENSISTLVVKYNTKLKHLDCSVNSIKKLDVSKNPELERLAFSENQIQSIDVRNNPKLVWLDCASNEISELDLSNNSKIDSLWCYSNNIARLDVGNLTALRNLSCSSNRLTSLDLPVSADLKYLSCYDNQIQTINVHPCEKLITALDDGNTSEGEDYISYWFGEEDDPFSKIVVDTTTLVVNTHIPIVTKPAKVATCTQTGLTEEQTCSICKEITQKQESIPALGHAYGSWMVTTPATTTTEGVETRTCGRCGAKELRAIPKVVKDAQPMTVAPKSPSVKASKLKKKAQSIKVGKAFTVSNAQGAVSYKKIGGSKKLSIDNAGKITVAKGTKKGTYKLTVTVSAAGNDKYYPGSQKVTIKVAVK